MPAPSFFKTIFSFILILLFSPKVFSQQNTPQIDSLKNVLQSLTTDTAKALCLANISFRYSTVDPPQGIKYGQKTLQLSTKIHFKKGMAAAQNSLGLNFMIKGDYKMAYQLFKASGANYKEIGYRLGEAVNFRNKGILYQHFEQYDKALECAILSARIYSEIHNTDGVGSEFCNIGNIYLDLSRHDKALQYFLTALDLGKTKNNSTDRAVLLNNIAFTYIKLNNIPEAKKYCAPALEISRILNDRYVLTISYRNMGTIYTEEKNLSAAKMFLDSSLNAALELGDKNRQAKAYCSIGRYYLENVKASNGSAIKNAPDSALKYLEKAKDISKQLSRKDNVSADLLEQFSYLSQTYSLMNKGDNSSYYKKKAEDIISSLKLERLDMEEDAEKELQLAKAGVL